MTQLPRRGDVSAVSDETVPARPDDVKRGEAAILSAALTALSTACRCRPDQAFDALLDAARRHHVGVPQLARGLVEILGDLPRRQAPLRGAAAIAFQLWGRRLILTKQLEPGVDEDSPARRSGSGPPADRELRSS
jgi:hypothetical protein